MQSQVRRFLDGDVGRGLCRFGTAPSGSAEFLSQLLGVRRLVGALSGCDWIAAWFAGRLHESSIVQKRECAAEKRRATKAPTRRRTPRS
jgi:hypothetical protein